MIIHKSLLVVISTLLIAGCSSPKVTETTVLDTRYTPAHSEVVTTYEYKLDVLTGDLVLVPDIHSKWGDDVYEVYEQYTYDNGKVKNRWRECDYGTYCKFNRGGGSDE